MKNTFKHLRDSFDTKLPSAERDRLRSEFHTFMDRHPIAAAPRLIPSPYAFARFGAVYAVIVLILATTPVLYAAERSYPNDFLYSIKTDVLEAAFVGVASLTSDEAEADANTSIVSRRLIEAETLIARDAMEPEDALQLKTRIEASVRKIHAHVEQATQKGQLEEAFETGSELENALEAHEYILDVLTENEESNTMNSDELLQSIEGLGDHTENIADNVEEKLNKESETETDLYFSGIADETRIEIESLIKAVTAAKTANGDLVDDAGMFLKLAEAFRSEALLDRAEGRGGPALSNMRRAHESASQGLILMRSGNSLEQE